MDNASFSSVLTEIDAVARAEAMPLYLVGGVVRDLLLGSPLHDRDIDLVVEGDAAQLARAVAVRRGGEVREFPRFLTAKVVFQGATKEVVEEIDFASAREERYDSPGALPTVTPASLKRDLERRDFTINALALPLPALIELFAHDQLIPERLYPHVIDNHGGVADLATRTIRILHSRSFEDDPTRAFRGCRYGARLRGEFDAATATSLADMVSGGGLETISTFRKFAELRHIFEEEHITPALQRLHAHGILSRIDLIDECKIADLLERYESLDRLRTMGDPPAREALRTVAAALLYEAGSVETRTTAWKHLNLPRAERQKLAALAALAAGEPSEFSNCGEAELGMLAVAARHPAIAERARAELLARVAKRGGW